MQQKRIPDPLVAFERNIARARPTDISTKRQGVLGFIAVLALGIICAYALYQACIPAIVK